MVEIYLFLPAIIFLVIGYRTQQYVLFGDGENFARKVSDFFSYIKATTKENSHNNKITHLGESGDSHQEKAEKGIITSKKC